MKNYRVVCTCYDLYTHKPRIKKVLNQMHATRIRAIQAAQKAALASAASILDENLSPPYAIGIRMDDKFQASQVTTPAVVTMGINNCESTCFKYDIWEVRERDNTGNNFTYRGFCIERDESGWYWILPANDDKCDFKQSGRSIEACCDIIDEMYCHDAEGGMA